MTPSRETQGPKADTRPRRRFADRRAILPFVLVIAALPVGLAQSWMAHERRCVAYDLGELDERMTLVRDELSEAHIAVEELRSPGRADAIAAELGLVRLEGPPVVVAGDSDKFVAESPASEQAWPPSVLSASFASFGPVWPFGRAQGSQAK